MFGEDKEKLNVFFEVMTKEGVLIQKVDGYKKAAFSVVSRAFFQQFTAFIAEFVKSNPTMRCLPDGSQDILRIASELAEKSPYDSCTLTFEELADAGKRQALDINKWTQILPAFKAAGDACKMVKSSGAAGMGLRIDKKNLGTFIRYHKVLAALHKGNLSS